MTMPTREEIMECLQEGSSSKQWILLRRVADALDGCVRVPKEHCMCPACRQGVIHDSGCAVHNEPAMPVGACDCSIRPSIDSAIKAQNPNAFAFGFSRG
jgi:hypothetical protein